MNTTYPTLTLGTPDYERHYSIVKGLIHNLALDQAKKAGIIYLSDIRNIIADVKRERPDLMLPLSLDSADLGAISDDIFEDLRPEIDKLRKTT